MSKADIAVEYFKTYNCAQSVLAAYSEDYGLSKDIALSIASGFGAGIGRLQETCGAVSGAIKVLGLAGQFKESDGREKLNLLCEKIRCFTDEFSDKMGTIKCLDLINCDLSTEEGRKHFKDNNLKVKCQDYVRLSCEILDTYLGDGK